MVLSALTSEQGPSLRSTFLKARLNARLASSMRFALTLLIEIGKISAELLYDVNFEGLELLECESSLDEHAVTLNGSTGGENEISGSAQVGAVVC